MRMTRCIPGLNRTATPAVSPMPTLNRAATKTLDALTEGLTSPGDSRKVDTSSFMAVHVEMIGTTPAGAPLFSVAHYFVQNGDMCQDPEMVFMQSTVGIAAAGDYFPVMFQQAIPPVYQEAMNPRTGEHQPRLMAQLASFANTWMKNIKDQQELGHLSETA